MANLNETTMIELNDTNIDDVSGGFGLIVGFIIGYHIGRNSKC